MPAEATEDFMSTKPNRRSGKADQEQSLPDAVPVSPDARGARTAETGTEQGASPSNTAPNNSKEEKNKEDLPFFQALRWGVDSLYVSYKGKLTLEAEIILKRLKELAQSQRPSDAAVAQLKIGDHIFEVKDKGTGLFAFILEDNAFRIQIAKSGSKALPMAYVKFSSQYLTARTPWEIVEELDELLASISSHLEEPKVSRIDLFVDFVSSVDMESWDRNAWVTRANSINTYSVSGQFSGWTVGLGGTIAARLYDKFLEVVTQSKKDYLFPLWQKAGWDTDKRVWRLEFEFKQESISQLGIKGFDAVMESLGGIWGYATTEWLRLTEPNWADATRSRWPIHPLWTCLASIDWEEDGGPLSRTFPVSRQPGTDWLMTHGLSALTSFMATQGIYDLDQGLTVFREQLYAYHDEKAFLFGQSLSSYVWDKVALKVRQYNAGMNADQLSDEVKQAKGLNAAADAYRKASDGE
jgi:hypothetical protein